MSALYPIFLLSSNLSLYCTKHALRPFLGDFPDKPSSSVTTYPSFISFVVIKFSQIMVMVHEIFQNSSKIGNHGWGSHFWIPLIFFHSDIPWRLHSYHSLSSHSFTHQVAIDGNIPIGTPISFEQKAPSLAATPTAHSHGIGTATPWIRLKSWRHPPRAEKWMVIWLVVEPYPSEKIWKSLSLGWLNSEYGKMKHVSNHQPVYNL